MDSNIIKIDEEGDHRGNYQRYAGRGRTFRPQASFGPV